MLTFLKQKYINLVSDIRFSEILTASAWALSGRVIDTILVLAFTVLVARLYGAEIVGIVAVINSFLMMITIFTVFGTGPSIFLFAPKKTGTFG